VDNTESCPLMHNHYYFGYDDGSSLSEGRYTRPVCQASSIYIKTALARRKQAGSLGKMPTTFVRRCTSLLTRSSPLVVRIWRWCATGKEKRLSLLGCSLPSNLLVWKQFFHTSLQLYAGRLQQRKKSSEQIRVKRMVYELTRRGYDVSIVA
jgi:hypothetical protein